VKFRILLAFCLLLAGIFLLAAPVLAGGWAVITLDELPSEVVAGQPLEIGFTVRQHGVTPLEGLNPNVYARQAGLRVSEQASAQGESGHYIATLILPRSGEWEWSIQAFTGNQPMPTLHVTETPVSIPSSVRGSLPVKFPIIAVGLGLAGLAMGVMFFMRRKARWAIALILAGFIVSAESIVSAAGQLPAESEAKGQAANATFSQVEVGRRLFVAKGCMVCHSNADTNPIREFGVDIGPDLSDFSASPEYLHLWLADPQLVKPETGMPELDLSETEIESLIAYLNER